MFKKICKNYDFFLRRIEEKSGAIDELFRIYNIEEVKPVVVNSSEDQLSVTIMIIIIVACVLFFLAVIACVVICLTSSK